MSVTGARFMNVDTKLNVNEATNDFTVDITVQGADEEGAVEYRVFQPGQSPPETWTPSEAATGHRVVTLHSPAIPIGPAHAVYSLMIEARSPSGTAVQQYPFTFRLGQTIIRTDIPTPNR